MSGERSCEGELSDEYMTMQNAAVARKQERDALRHHARALHAAFAAAAARYDQLLAEWQAELSRCALSPPGAEARCDEFDARARASGDQLAALTVARRATGERIHRARRNGSHVHLRVLRRRLDRVLFDPPPAPGQPLPARDAMDETAHLFHDMRAHLQMAVLAAAGLRRDLPTANIERWYRALERGLIGLTEDLEALAPVAERLPSRPVLTLVPAPAAPTALDLSHDG